MKIANRIKSQLKQEPLTVGEIRQLLPDVLPVSIKAIICQRQDIFLKLRNGLVGLKNRDEHLLPKQLRKITPPKKKQSQIETYKQIVNLLVCGPMQKENLLKHLPEQTEESIHAEIAKHPELFIQIKPGLTGRTGRDEYLKEKYGRN